MIESKFYKRLHQEIFNYLSVKVEVSEGVYFSQYQTIKRIMKFKNRDLTGTKINEDLSYNYYFDIVSPRVDSEVKNLSFQTKDILIFSSNPTQDFAAVYILNAKLLDWMMNNGEEQKINEVTQEYVSNGNVGFKRTATGYDKIDPLNTYHTNTLAEDIDDTDIIERHEMTASELKDMTTWDAAMVQKTIEECGNKFFNATELSTKIPTGMNKYEIFEYTGEISELEFNEVNQIEGGDKDTYFLAKIVVSGLQQPNKGEKYILFAEKLNGKLSNYYIYSHRGEYQGRFWRLGMFETLFDHQIRANQIANDIAQGLDWASKTIFRSKDTQVMQNIRADLENGDVVITDDLEQVDVQMHSISELLNDWNRLMTDADTVSNSNAITRGVMPPIGQSFRILTLVNDNALKMFAFLRESLCIPFQKVFREWMLPLYVKDLKGEEIFRLVGDEEVLDKFREIYVNAWYMKNLVEIGPHDQPTMEAIKAEKLAEIQSIDPVIQNAAQIWADVMSRLFVTITGSNYKVDQTIQDMTQLMQLESDPNRIVFLLNTIYAMKGIPIPPVTPPQPQQLPSGPQQPDNGQPQPAQQQQQTAPQHKGGHAPQPQPPQAQSPQSVPFANPNQSG